MKRREFIVKAAAAAAEVMLTGQTSTEASPRGESRPNILFIMTDQQHAGMMSCTTNKWLKTPAMDQLAASGIRFERAYACNPVCVPNRFSLQTGLMPSAIGMGQNGDSERAAVTDAMVQQSLGSLFRQAGYETVYGGKVHLPARMNDVDKLGYRNLTGDSRQGLADACAKFIKGKHARPFLLFASFINPHDICYMAINDFRRANGKAAVGNIDSRTCEAVLESARASGDIDAFVAENCPALPTNHAVPEAEPECITDKYVNARPFRAYIRQKWTENQWRLHRWAYCRLTEMVDKEIDIVLDALREAELEDKTLIVFTSDHGDMDAAHKMEHKSVLYEESVRVPFITSYRGVIPGGVVDNEHLVSNGLDLLPTLCDYAGIKVPKGLRGLSLRPLAEGKEAAAWRDYVVSESQNGRMLQTGRFKYCVYDSGRDREQLMDLKSDPGEMKNLAERGEFKDALDKHRQLLHKWVKNNNDSIAAEYIVSES
ncbi:MAG TPA: sulfatase-like hydrolase/transferase [Sedimentisphaerales bacterium]|nr:sulfatase-like hydrolase/transferase [Sedimentisphaerales bacterium]